MNNMFMANTMMVMNMQHQMMHQQHMMHSLRPSTPYSYVHQPKTPTTIIYQQPTSNISYEHRDVPMPDNPLFDEREIVNGMTGENRCYIKVNVLDEKSIEIKAEIKEGILDEEELKEIFISHIYTAISHGYEYIHASIGKQDEMGERILEEIGFSVKKIEENENGNI